MSYYPLFVELEEAPCLVVGGGAVAAQKTKALVSCGASVMVVSPTLTAGLKRFHRAKKIRWLRRRFRKQDLTGVKLVVVATSDGKLNCDISQWAKRRRIWVNVVDQPALCSFIVPSVVRRGQLVLAISTGGASPALAKWIRKDLQRRYGPEYGLLLEGAASRRSALKEKVPGHRRRKRLYEAALRAYFETLEKGIG